MIFSSQAESDAEHMPNLQKVLKQIKEHGARLNKDKCQFVEDVVEYLGHSEDAKAVHPAAKNLTLILEALKPWKAQECHSFLGLIYIYN